MSVYVSNILTAAISFPFIAFFITLPYLIYQYRKVGSVPWLRTLIVYSFVFYLLCVYFLVILPLPADHSAVVPYAQTPQLVPFEFLREFAADTTFSLDSPSTWLGALTNPPIYETFFNILMTVPLGMYLRYWFRRTWWQTLIIGFLTTLFFELSQLTGLWGLYAHPYRLFDVDDLIQNTFGAMVGFWAVGPALRVLPDVRLVNEEAREEGLRASVTRRALSFFIDLVLAQVAAGVFVAVATALGAQGTAGAPGMAPGLISQTAECVGLAIFFVLAPAITQGQTLGQKLLKLRIVRPDASPARWYQYLARYGLLYLLAIAPFYLLNGIVFAHATQAGEAGALVAFAARHQEVLIWIWLALMAVWCITLVVRAVRAAVSKRPFIMLNGVLSNTRVMTTEGVERERDRRQVLDVADVAALERLIAADGTSLDELMDRAGRAVADTVRLRVPDPAPVVVLAGSGNNGGDGWVCAHALAQAGYPATLVAANIAERLHAEPARQTAIDAFADASARDLPLNVVIAPDADVLADLIDNAAAVVDALLGTGFSGAEVREPYASWITAANRRRFEGSRGKGRGRHRRRTNDRGDHERTKRRTLPARVKDAPFAVAVDAPSGLSAQSGAAARPTFAADVTVTMIAYKPGLVVPAAARWTGSVRLAKLVDAKPFLERLRADAQDAS